MKTYLEHLMESDREYEFRIKSIELLDEEKMDRLERVLRKYELRDISGPTKTIIQEHPLDFYDIQNAEVYIVDVVLGVPQSSYILQQELRANLGISENHIVVRSDNDPLEVETQRIKMSKDIRDQAKDKDLSKASLLDVNEVYPEAEHSVDGDVFYGDEYNSKFLDTLAQVSVTRKEGIEQPQDQLFDWLRNEIGDETQITDDNDFNQHIEDAPKVVPWWKAKNKDAGDAELELRRSTEGNLDNDHEERNVEFEDKTGKRKTLSSKSEKVRK